MCFISRFFQCVALISFLVFQFMMIVFLAMVSAIESILLDVLFRLMFDVSPSRQCWGQWYVATQERRKVICDVPPELLNWCAVPCGMHVVIGGVS